jgi:hypothetical protein
MQNNLVAHSFLREMYCLLVKNKMYSCRPQIEVAENTLPVPEINLFVGIIFQ